MENSNSLVLTGIQKEYIQNLCMIGIAKTHLKNKKYAAIPNYSRVNLQIRSYMIPVMTEIINQKKEQNKNVVYIGVNPKALSFTETDFP